MPELPLDIPLDYLGLEGWSFRCRLDGLARKENTWYVRELKTTTQVNTKRLDLDPQSVMAYPWAVKRGLNIEVEGSSTVFVRRQDPLTARTPIIVPYDGDGIIIPTSQQAWTMWEKQLVQTVQAMKRTEFFAEKGDHPLAVYNANYLGCAVDCSDYSPICVAEIHNPFGASVVIEEEYTTREKRSVESK